MVDGVARGPLAVVGMSINENCGVHDQARVLSEALEADGLPCSFHWLRRRAAGLRGAFEEVGAWRRALEGELAAERARAVLLHYSVFSYSYRGLPLFTAPLVRALRHGGAPLIAELHEAAYPFGLGGARGLVWAGTQRAALVALMRAVSGVIVTADFRAAWLEQSRWLPRRTVVMSPVFSNLPEARAAARGDADGGAGSVRVGVFGYSYESAAPGLSLEAIGRLRRAGLAAELCLLGAPGPDSPGGEGWRREAEARGLGDALRFSGALPAQQLSDELAACDLLLFPDLAGASSRKSTLAAALASGVPVVALDGPYTWRAILDARAARVVEPSAEALATALGELLNDAALRRELGARGREFAAGEMSPASAVRAVRGLLGE